MTYKLISFDLQGTLSNSSFSDEFWLERLPELFAIKYSLSMEEAKARLKAEFTTIGRYHRRYYSPEDWLKELAPGQSLAAVSRTYRHRPELYADTLQILEELQAGNQTLIIISTTTHTFIDLELGSEKSLFQAVYSTLDDLGVPGKTPAVFRKLAAHHKAATDESIHIGDCLEMDITNAQAAGWNTFFFDKKAPRGQVVSQLREALSLPQVARR